MSLSPLCVVVLLGTGLVRAEKLIGPVEERQITSHPQGHILTNSSIWSPDGQWIVYDLRRSPDKFDGTRIEAVNVQTGEVRALYESKNGAACGVATWHPHDPRVVFILGPEAPSADWSYGASRRRGAIVDLRDPGKIQPLDAMNYAAPFAPGALRGGSHVHVFHADGRLLSFTYEDEILSRLDPSLNQRNIGVALAGHPVTVNRHHPRNHDGDYFSTVVTRTTAQPKPGSDEISRACEEAWIGTHGYICPDGSRQEHALAFQGQVTAADGTKHYEVFVIDLPADLTKPGAAPLEGTASTYPAPPAGTRQRRLTFTDARKYPGLQGPRHWLKTSPDGSQIAFLMKDDAGVVQLWTISPHGGEPRQLTKNSWDIASAFSWSPDGKLLAHLMDGSVFVTRADTGEPIRLTRQAPAAETPEPYACVISPDGRHIAYTRPQGGFDQIFTVAIPASLTSP